MTENAAMAVELPADLSFEDAYAQLEDVLAALEAGDLTLDESLARYELGVALTEFCERKLEQAELRVRKWLPDNSTEALDDWQEEG
jgi:exodeoxyribonuclease VII small subunit